MSKTEKITYPPVEYLFFEYEQPNKAAWEAILDFANAWNNKHKNQFQLGEENELGIILENGIEDEEKLFLDQALAALKGELSISWFAGVVDMRKPEDYEKAPFVQIIGDQYPLEFITNYDQVFESSDRCKLCGKTDFEKQLTSASLIVDESFLDKQIHPATHYSPPGLDLINLPNGGLLISQQVKQLLKKHHIQGYELHPVISHLTDKPSKRLHLIRAQKAVLNPCEVHTPREDGAICPACGRIKGGILGYYYVREEWLNGEEIFSRHPFKYASMYISNRLYSLMKAQNLKGLLPAFGIYSCSHKNSTNEGGYSNAAKQL